MASREDLEELRHIKILREMKELARLKGMSPSTPNSGGNETGFAAEHESATWPENDLPGGASRSLIFELWHDLRDAVAAMPRDHRKHPMLELLGEAIRRDIHFIDRHPTTLFQCMWNTCWWYDCLEADRHYHVDTHGVAMDPKHDEDERLCTYLQTWRFERESELPGFVWAKSLRPPVARLGSGQAGVLSGHTMGVKAVVICGNGALVISRSWDNTVRIWDTKSGYPLLVIASEEGELLAAMPQGSLFAFQSGERIHVWDAFSLTECCQMDCQSEQVRGLAFSQEAQLVLYQKRGELHVLDPLNGRALADPLPTLSCAARPTFSSQGEYLALGSGSGTSIWDVTRGRRVWVADGVGGKCVAVSHNGRLLASGTDDGSIVLCDSEKGVLWRADAHSNFVSCLCFSPDASLLVSAGGLTDNTVKVWETLTGKERSCYLGHQDYVEDLAFSSDGDSLVSGAIDRTIRLWSVSGKRVTHRLDDHSVPLHGTAPFSPDGRFVVSESHVGEARVWDVSTGCTLGKKTSTGLHPLPRMPSCASSYYAQKRGSATAVFSSVGDTVCCWVPGELEFVSFHHLCAAFSGHEEESPHLNLFCICNAPQEDPIGATSSQMTSFRRLSGVSHEDIFWTVSPQELQATQAATLLNGNISMFISSLLDEADRWEFHDELKVVLFLLNTVEESAKAVGDDEMLTRLIVKQAKAHAHLGHWKAALSRCNEAIRVCRDHGWREERASLASYRRRLRWQLVASAFRKYCANSGKKTT